MEKNVGNPRKKKKELCLGELYMLYGSRSNNMCNSILNIWSRWINDLLQIFWEFLAYMENNNFVTPKIKIKK